MYPSVKRIASVLNLDADKARKVRGLMDGKIDPESFASVSTWVAQCFHKPRKIEMVMCAIDEVLETHGVEALTIENAYVSHFYQNIVAVYCNTGDTYAATVILDSATETFRLGSWGDYVEAYERAHGIREEATS